MSNKNVNFGETQSIITYDLSSSYNEYLTADKVAEYSTKLKTCISVEEGSNPGLPNTTLLILEDKAAALQEFKTSFAKAKRMTGLRCDIKNLLILEAKTGYVENR